MRGVGGGENITGVLEYQQNTIFLSQQDKKIQKLTPDLPPHILSCNVTK